MQQAVGPIVSVIVSSHRREYVGALAEACGGGSLKKAEVIIVADYDIRKYAEKFPSVHWVHDDRKSIPAKRNAGCRKAQADIYAFIDDDCVPYPDWIDKAMDHLDRHPGQGAVVGRTVVESAGESAPLSEFRRLERRGYRTNNLFFRKQAFWACGSFDERFTVQREDADLAFSALEAGIEIGYCPDAAVMHRVRHNEKWDLLKNCVNRRFDPLLFRKHPALYREHVGSPVPPAVGLVMVFHLLLLFTLAACPALWPYAAGLDCAAALALSFRRNRSGGGGLFWIVRDVISFLFAPFVLTGALIYGSITFRKLLLF
jgi:glycosyltransferase involved in cell wall biosynthesis